jgi:ATP-dependent helicase HrpA
MRVAVIGPDGRELDASRDLASLKSKKWPMGVSPSSDRWTKARKEWERNGITDWDFGMLPEKISVGPFVTAYPALEPEEQGASIRLFPSEEQARHIHRKGVRAIFSFRFQKDLGFVQRYMVLPDEIQQQTLYFGGKEAVEKALTEALQKEAFERDIRSEEEFLACSESLTRDLFQIGHSLGEVVKEILSTYQKVRMALAETENSMGKNQAIKSLIGEIRQDLDRVIPEDFLLQYSLDRLRNLPRYLEAMRLRVERAKHDPAKDQAKAEQALRFVQSLKSLDEDAAADDSSEKKAGIEEYRWMVEEFKVSLFAPELKTAFPISAKRLLKKLKAIQTKS